MYAGEDFESAGTHWCCKVANLAVKGPKFSGTREGSSWSLESDLPRQAEAHLSGLREEEII